MAFIDKYLYFSFSAYKECNITIEVLMRSKSRGIVCVEKLNFTDKNKDGFLNLKRKRVGFYLINIITNEKKTPVIKPHKIYFEYKEQKLPRLEEWKPISYNTFKHKNVAFYF